MQCNHEFPDAILINNLSNNYKVVYIIKSQRDA
jgi:hypothetical protein